MAAAPQEPLVRQRGARCVRDVLAHEVERDPARGEAVGRLPGARRQVREVAQLEHLARVIARDRAKERVALERRAARPRALRIQQREERVLLRGVDGGLEAVRETQLLLLAALDDGEEEGTLARPEDRRELRRTCAPGSASLLTRSGELVAARS